jgi:hypothetical protein
MSVKHSQCVVNRAHTSGFVAKALRRGGLLFKRKGHAVAPQDPCVLRNDAAANLLILF